MASQTQGESIIHKPKHVVQLTVCPTKMSIKTEKTYRDKTMKEIVSNICALLNSGGGRLVLFYEKTPPNNHILDCVRKIEQRIQEVTGSAKMVSKIQKNVLPNRIDFLVRSSEGLFTLNYNLYLPTKAQVIPVLPTDSVKDVQEIILGRNSLVREALSSHRRDFVKNQHMGLEEEINVQFKSLKASPAQRIKIADRIVNKSNKFACYVSAFANHNGGHIYYGISDDGIVEGEEIKEKDVQEIIKKVGKAMSKIVWPGHYGEPKRGQEWEIYFEPVKDREGKPIPHNFVIVVAVACCPGGVFIDEPESYCIVDSKAEKMSLVMWKEKLMSIKPEDDIKEPLEAIKSDGSDEGSRSHRRSRLNNDANEIHATPQSTAKVKSLERRAELIAPSDNSGAGPAIEQTSNSAVLCNVNMPPLHVSLYSWSSEKNRNIFTCLTSRLVQLRNDNNMKNFRKLCKWAKEKFPDSDAHLVEMAEEVAVAYKNHRFRKANSCLEKLDKLVSESAKDGSIFEVRLLYLRSRIERAKENYKTSYEIARAGLQMVQQIPAGFMTVWSYMNAAYLATVLSCRESDPEKRNDLKNEERKYLELAQRDSITLKDLPIKMTDLKQKLHIYQAMSYVGCPLTGEAFNGRNRSNHDLDRAVLHLSEVNSSILEGSRLSHFRYIQYLLVQSELLRLRSEGLSNPVERLENLKRCFTQVEEAQGLANKYHFEEMIVCSDKRLTQLTETLVRNNVTTCGDDDEKWLKELGMQCLTEPEDES